MNIQFGAYLVIFTESMGISEEIEDAKITAVKTKISRLKRRPVIDYYSRDQIEHSDKNCQNS